MANKPSLGVCFNDWKRFCFVLREIASGLDGRPLSGLEAQQRAQAVLIECGYTCLTRHPQHVARAPEPAHQSGILYSISQGLYPAQACSFELLTRAFSIGCGMHRRRRNAAQSFCGRNRPGHGAAETGAVIKWPALVSSLGRPRTNHESIRGVCQKTL
jgi:hypothetical protein